MEDAGLNASAPPEQRWMDGWLVRTNPGKAQRARCINAVAEGRERWQSKLQRCEALYRRLGLPILVRITPFTRPADLDPCLAKAGYRHHDDTRVMVLPSLDQDELRHPAAPPAGTTWGALDPDAYAQAVGAIRGSTAEARRAHAARLRSSPVRYCGYALFDESGVAIACGQFAAEEDLVGLYDIATAAGYQGQGLATWLCKRLLTTAATEAGSRSAYLQVGADNQPARRIYDRLGFEDAYSYHYRLAPQTSPG